LIKLLLGNANLEQIRICGTIHKETERKVTPFPSSMPLPKLRSLVLLPDETGMFDFFDGEDPEGTFYPVLRNWILNTPSLRKRHVGFQLPNSNSKEAIEFLESIHHLGSIGVYILTELRDGGKDGVLEWFIKNKPTIHKLSLLVVLVVKKMWQIA